MLPGYLARVGGDATSLPDPQGANRGATRPRSPTLPCGSVRGP
jgi:hypothetical protein